MDIVGSILSAGYVINLLLVLSMIFLERRSFTSIVCWSVVLNILPVVGIIFYLCFGAGLSSRTRKLIRNHKIYEFEYDNATEELESDKNKPIIDCVRGYGSELSLYNDVEFFRVGTNKLESLKNDLKNAKETINIEYYIFRNDRAGKEIMDILLEKQREGVKVKFIYDSIGCLGTSRRFFNKLKKAGGEVAEFFPPFAHIRLLDLKVNYRNHRKIVVIDGKIGYTGGMNIRDDHIYSSKKKTSPWRDTHLRIVGDGVNILQSIFLSDFAYCKNQLKPIKEYEAEGYFVKNGRKGDIALQVVSSGPDNISQNIKHVYIKMITNAKHKIFIQSPYFIPDDSFMSALKIALNSGVEVSIMLPEKPDHRSIFQVSRTYLEEVWKLGAKVYLYKGFLHTKALLVDDDIVSIGTCNIDNRSFGLNFEDTVIMYSKELSESYYKSVDEDISNSKQLDHDYFKKRGFVTRFFESIYRLFSPYL